MPIQRDYLQRDWGIGETENVSLVFKTYGDHGLYSLIYLYIRSVLCMILL